MRVVTVHCSPDADDLFMMRALTEGLIDTGEVRFDIDTSPTDALNRLASGDGGDVVAISIAHYPRVSEHYQLLPHGGSMGEGYGPVVVARDRMSVADLAGRRVAVPGTTTTAWATLRLVVDVEPVVIPITPYARIFEALRSGEVDAGLIIHEGRLTFEQEGFAQVLDLGQWWLQETGLPLPLGANAIRRDLPDKARISDLLRQSIAHGLEHRREAIDWLLARGGPLSTHEAVDRYLQMYANRRTLDYGEAGRAGILEFFRRTAAAGILPECVVDFAD